MAKSKQNEAQAKNKQQSKNQPGQSSAQGQTSSQGAVELLKQDHRKVEQLFEQFEQADDQDRQHELAHQICKELMVHTMIEEEIFYPACRSGAKEDEDTTDKLDEAQVEHDSAKILINEILRGEPADEFWKAKVCVLKDQVAHHVEEEEKPDDGVMAKAQAEGVDTPDLANRLTRRKSELMSRTGDMRPARAVSLLQPTHHMGQSQMGGGGMGYAERGERGRFMGEDEDRGYGRSRGYGGEEGGSERGGYGERRGSRYEEEEGRGRSRYQDEDYGRGPGQGGRYGGEGRSRSEGSRGSGEERRSSRYEEDDERGEGSHGGWFGDSRGHSEASRRGWQHRR